MYACIRTCIHTVLLCAVKNYRVGVQSLIAGSSLFTRLGPIPKLGPTGARNFLSTSVPILSDLSTRALLVTTSATGALVAGSDGRLLGAFGLDSYR